MLDILLIMDVWLIINVKLLYEVDCIKLKLYCLTAVLLIIIEFEKLYINIEGISIDKLNIWGNVT